jgi:hypothetical protein
MRRVHHLAQAKHERGAPRLEVGQRVLDLTAQAERFLVDDEDIRPEGLGCVADDRLAHP